MAYTNPVVNQLENTIMMPQGMYYVGDLCYVMHDAWDEICDILFEGHTCKQGEFELKDGRRFAIYNTAYGDGYYSSNGHGKFAVDAGSIGCVLMSDIRDNSYSLEQLSDLAKFHLFDQDFSTYSIDGTLTFGEIDIYTNDMEEEEEEDEYDDED